MPDRLHTGRPFFSTAMVLLVAVGLSGCANRPASTGGNGGTATAGTSVASDGVYKVGAPYQIKGVTYYPSEDYAYDETGIASWYGPGFHEKLTGNGEIFDQNELTAAHRTLPMPSFVRVTNLDNGRSVVLRVNDRGPYAHSRILDVSRRGAQLLGFETAGTARVRVQILADESRQIADAMRANSRVAGDPASKGSGVLIARGTPMANEPKPQAVPRNGVVAESLAPPPSVKSSQPATPVMAAAPASSALAAGAAPVPMPADPTGQVVQTAPRSTRLFIQVAALSNPDNARALSQRLKPIGPTQITTVQAGSQQLHRVRIGPISSVEDGDRMLDDVIQKAGFPDARLIVD